MQVANNIENSKKITEILNSKEFQGKFRSSLTEFAKAINDLEDIFSRVGRVVVIDQINKNKFLARQHKLLINAPKSKPKA